MFRNWIVLALLLCSVVCFACIASAADKPTNADPFSAWRDSPNPSPLIPPPASITKVMDAATDKIVAKAAAETAKKAAEAKAAAETAIAESTSCKNAKRFINEWIDKTAEAYAEAETATGTAAEVADKQLRAKNTESIARDLFADALKTAKAERSAMDLARTKTNELSKAAAKQAAAEWLRNAVHAGGTADSFLKCLPKDLFTNAELAEMVYQIDTVAKNSADTAFRNASSLSVPKQAMGTDPFSPTLKR
jgi:hypothetical protein